MGGYFYFSVFVTKWYYFLCETIKKGERRRRQGDLPPLFSAAMIYRCCRSRLLCLLLPQAREGKSGARPNKLAFFAAFSGVTSFSEELEPVRQACGQIQISVSETTGLVFVEHWGKVLRTLPRGSAICRQRRTAVATVLAFPTERLIFYFIFFGLYRCFSRFFMN